MIPGQLFNTGIPNGPSKSAQPLRISSDAHFLVFVKVIQPCLNVECTKVAVPNGDWGNLADRFFKSQHVVIDQAD